MPVSSSNSAGGVPALQSYISEKSMIYGLFFNLKEILFI